MVFYFINSDRLDYKILINSIKFMLDKLFLMYIFM